MSDKMRSEFEEIHCGNNKHVIRRNEHGLYVLPSIQDAWGGFQSAWQAARTVPEGFVVVPVEPTQEMLKAGERGIGVSSYVRKGMTIREYRFFKSGWDAMLAAAPEGKK